MANLSNLIVNGTARFLNEIKGKIDWSNILNKPTIPTVNNATLTIQKNGTSVATFTANSATNATANITVPTVTNTYSSTGTDATSGKAVAAALGTLDGTVSGTAGSSKTLTAFSQTDGKVSATFGNISITKSQVSDFPTSMPASDVYSWAKASSKPSYSASEVGAIATTVKGAANGVAELDANGLVPSSQLPSYVDDVLEYSAKSSFPTTGETGKIYVDTSTNLTYRWSGTAYVEISPSLALGTTSSTAYRGDYGNTAYTHATDANRLTTAKTEGLYKIATTAEGHIKSVTAVAKSDITGLGIPGSDTNTHRPIQVNGTQILGDNTTALNLKAGGNVSVTNSSGTVTIAATDTKYTANTTSIGSASAGTAIAADDITAWSAGTVPTLGTAIPADDITAWTSNTPTSCAISGGVLTFTAGSAASLSYTAKSIPNVTSVGTAPSLSYTARSIPNISVTATTVATGITAS